MYLLYCSRRLCDVTAHWPAASSILVSTSTISSFVTLLSFSWRHQYSQARLIFQTSSIRPSSGQSQANQGDHHGRHVIGVIIASLVNASTMHERLRKPYSHHGSSWSTRNADTLHVKLVAHAKYAAMANNAASSASTSTWRASIRLRCHDRSNESFQSRKVPSLME